jgi:DNA-directed RNA polymerase specialized sigma24 family protein
VSPPDSTASFEPYRRRLIGLAYRMLGSIADAEDAVQETYLRWHGADRDQVSDPRAFLMTTTAWICLDLLTSARARREEYTGPFGEVATTLDRSEAACRQLAAQALVIRKSPQAGRTLTLRRGS